MPGKHDFAISQIDAMSAVRAVNAALKKIDTRLVDHGDRVAFIACRLCEAGGLELDLRKLFLLSVFHDIGAYKTEEIDRMVEFETFDVANHSVYGYLFLKYLSPLGEDARAILFHHTPWKKLQELSARGETCMEYAALICLADRIDIAAANGESSAAFKSIWNNTNEFFCPEYVGLFHKCYNGGELFRELSHGVLENSLRLCRSFAPSAEEALEYLKMIVFSIDFRSEHTVTHTINTISVALNIARHFGFTGDDLEKIYFGALLHDVGKVAIPEEILEYPGRLTDEQMALMRTHVDETDQLIRGIVPDDICEIAVRHHEKLDGSGYPHGLSAEELTLPQRIVAVADIASALSGRRSYKEPFPREKTVAILREMAGEKLDLEVCTYLCDGYDSIMESTENDRRAVIGKYQRITAEFDEIIKEAQSYNK